MQMQFSRCLILGHHRAQLPVWQFLSSHSTDPTTIHIQTTEKTTAENLMFIFVFRLEPLSKYVMIKFINPNGNWCVFLTFTFKFIVNS